MESVYLSNMFSFRAVGFNIGASQHVADVESTVMVTVLCILYVRVEHVAFAYVSRDD